MVRSLKSPQFTVFSNTQNFVIGQSLSERRLVGAYADVNFGWRDIVYLNLTGRNDWTSNA